MCTNIEPSQEVSFSVPTSILLTIYLRFIPLHGRIANSSTSSLWRLHSSYLVSAANHITGPAETRKQNTSSVITSFPNSPPGGPCFARDIIEVRATWAGNNSLERSAITRNCCRDFTNPWPVFIRALIGARGMQNERWTRARKMGKMHAPQFAFRRRAKACIENSWPAGGGESVWW